MNDSFFLSVCAGKQVLPSRKAALAVIKRRLFRSKARRNKRKGPRADIAQLQVYECRFCKGWHVGRGAPR